MACHHGAIPFMGITITKMLKVPFWGCFMAILGNRYSRDVYYIIWPGKSSKNTKMSSWIPRKMTSWYFSRGDCPLFLLLQRISAPPPIPFLFNHTGVDEI